MGFLENRENSLLELEKKNGQASLASDKEIFAQKLKNGLGEEIINELRNPTKPSMRLKLKFKTRRFFKQLSERIDILINQKKED